ncbi:hypothetical protein [Pseudarthrobacter sp. BIM B-2242]|uniref:hypothetical protein n=1 Tax=Pseudarthrobacter sp. BIM B-2242 TaxID=2772401 RepID=UPI00168A497E|nr:hypothetical protein [Pseudarthrobacter sp. BIM B-2242]QOD05815.1 hypothetical protein IDT60_22740 [Pseudarthrobacter sp. BIM B-2242]
MMPAQTAPAARKTAAKRTTRTTAARKTTSASRAAKPAATKTSPAQTRAAKAGTKTTAAGKLKTTPKTTSRTRTGATPKTAAKRAGNTTSAPRRKASRAPKPKAIEVLYSGKVFRSRLEARWAVFLDLLGVNWDYEPCHYEIGPDLYYLPDFYLPDHQTWLEVKGAPFMDTASYAKVLGAIAGPNPVPLREYPYTPSQRLLLGGPFSAPRHGLVPVHTLITPAGPLSASLTHATFSTGPGGKTAITPAGPAWDTVPATGIKAARRPSPERLALLLEPAPHLGPAGDDRIFAAYDAAYRLAFDETTRRVADNQARTLLAALAHRRSGRPLGVPQAA